MLGKKQCISNNDWHVAVRSISKTVPREYLDRLISRTANDIRKTVRGQSAAFAWSGGKDSLVLEQLCYLAGIRECVLVVSDLEYPAFMRWVANHKPHMLEIVNTGQDLQWLARNIDMLFPQDSATAAKWFHIVQHRGQAQYFKASKCDVLILGRRKTDGNYVGKGSNIYTSAGGITRFSPLAQWRHEDILAFIYYFNIPLPPFYGWPNGYCCGTHPWAARQWTRSVHNGWHEVYSIDSSIVTEAARYIDSAKEYLDSTTA